MCGTRTAREDHRHEAIELLDRVDASRLILLMDRLRLGGLLGRRLLDLGPSLDPWLEAQIGARMDRAGKNGTAHELISLALLTGLDHAGIRALGLKGSILARQVYDDPGARTAGDIDILVAAADLDRAIEVVQQMGWRHERHASRTTRLPVLHETLGRPDLPRVELHWRVHWYETKFATDALARAERPAPHQPLVMQAADGVAALMLFYARDGFFGLRMAADVAAWWDARCAGVDPDVLIDPVATSYPGLAGPLEVARSLLRDLVGLPTRAEAAGVRRRLAGQLATPFADLEPAQVLANASLVDLLLAPRGHLGDAVGRELQKIPENLERRLTVQDGLHPYLERSEHALRMLRRWAMALLPALLKMWQPGSATAEDRRA
ncbi:MAG TPA: nucleotidyltransferase family protein [Solirubrobacteraceae bacterium]|jgi:hypothetical protein|nr:nucleotidyltransferase family protein [Solirubrobacteraceae bacterium]